jgi:putative ABC transport system permease protein
MPFSLSYLELPDQKAVYELEQKLPAFLSRRLPKEKATQFTPSLQPLTDIHLRSHRIGEILPGGDIRYVYLFASLALFILLIACFNFMNLATANSAERAKEVGMRKTLGAQRWQLIGQFLGEAVLLSSIAFLLALIIVELSLPTFNAISGKNLLLQSIFANKLAIAGLWLGTIFVGIVAGSYPAFFLSAHKPVDTLRGRLGAGSGGEALRKGLVIFQFTLAIVLMTGTLVVYQQLRYLQNQRLGFDKGHVVILPIVEDRNMKFKKDLFKSAMLQHPSILKVTAASHVPGDKIGLRGNDDIDLREYRLDGIAETFHAAYLDADHDFAATLNLELVAGRWFAKEMATDSSAFVMNEAAARMFGMVSPEDILGRRLTRFKRYPDSVTIHIQGPVIGVVRDFHYASLHENVKPLIFNLPIGRWDANRFAIKIAAEDIRGTLDFLATKWKTYTKIYPFSYSFLNEKLNALYRSEQRLGKIFSIFAGLTILVACLGLFGLVSFTAERRTKEIGIRKVLGATVANLVALLSKDFVKLVVAANLIAWPMAYFAMNKWLQDFAYRIEIGWWMFVLAGGLALLIALLTVSTQAIKAALANPVEALRYE